MNRCLVMMALLLPAAASAQVVRRPYLQSVTTSSAVVAWTTATATDSRVRYGPAPGQLNQVAPLAAASTRHEVRLTGLQPGTRYFYAVGSAAGDLEGDDADHAFVTAPPVGDRAPFRAWVVGDSGTGDANQASVRDAMLAYAGRRPPDLFLHLGDMAYSSGTEGEFTGNFFAPYAGLLVRTPVWPTLGNHEGLSSDSATQTGPYYDAYVLPTAGEAGGLASGTEAYYAFDYGNVHFVVLDSQDSPRTPGGAMLTWLAADLAATAQEWVVALWHHPPYTKGSHDSDTEQQLIEMRENALPILEAGGVDLVLTGHSHIYERSFLIDGAYATPTVATGHLVDPGDGKVAGDGPYRKPAGLSSHAGAVYVVAGHGGASLGGTGGHPVMYASELAYGSCLLDVDRNRLELVNVRYDGAVTDRFFLLKGDGLVLGSPVGGEHLTGGAAHTITWATTGAVAQVNLELSLDDGATWSPIAGPLPNTGSYAWTVPAVDTALARVRVSSAADPGVFDRSPGSFAIATNPPRVAVPMGSVWRYEDSGTDLGTAWLAPGYDDSAWPSGPAQLGYGDGDEATVLALTTPRRPSAYFRRHLTLTAPLTQAHLQVIHDDGVEVWVNGSPVFSKYMGNGTDYAAWASATSADNELDSVELALSPDPFVVGDNVIAVMIKQASATSSDISFDLELSVTESTPAAGSSSGSTASSAGSTSGGPTASAGSTSGAGSTSASASASSGSGATSAASASSSTSTGGTTAGASSASSSSGGGTTSTTTGSSSATAAASTGSTGAAGSTGGSARVGAKGGCGCGAGGGFDALGGLLLAAALRRRPRAG